MTIRRSIAEPLRTGLTWDDQWAGPDGGLIVCWERGREKATEDPELAALAKAGQLVPLPWKGGVEAGLQLKHKFGTFSYLAMWQGLRCEDLSVDPSAEPTHTCAATGVVVTFTADSTKYANS
jgi:hypothetical protein